MAFSRTVNTCHGYAIDGKRIKRSIHWSDTLLSCAFYFVILFHTTNNISLSYSTFKELRMHLWTTWMRCEWDEFCVCSVGKWWRWHDFPICLYCISNIMHMILRYKMIMVRRLCALWIKNLEWIQRKLIFVEYVWKCFDGDHSILLPHIFAPHLSCLLFLAHMHKSITIQLAFRFTKFALPWIYAQLKWIPVFLLISLLLFLFHSVNHCKTTPLEH